MVFFLPFLEAFLPFLPLVVFIVANVNAYGFLFGFLLSWVGSVAGAYTVFLVIRKYGRASAWVLLQGMKKFKN